MNYMPWRVTEKYYIRNSRGVLIIKVPGSAYAEFIVRAVNNHDALVGALEDVIEKTDDVRWSEKADGTNQAIARAVQILAKAKGE